MGNKRTENLRTESFLECLLPAQSTIRSYIATLVPIASDVDDIYQETITIAWRKFDEFEPGTDFAAWAVKIAFYRILNYRRSRAKQHLQFKDEIFEQFAEVASRNAARTHESIAALNNCIEKLPESERKLLNLRYTQNIPIKSIAERCGRTANYIYRSFSRIHCKLQRCIKQTLPQEIV
ncbi:RNA polymerase sigma factor CnrH [Anaerohalosphaera lusitana]|uniref:RNA polymerase sigma factor CnrH n=1 Tax=Anaerohalosphaera lusitana TaxID=1936003 RepID=A0A1U9NLC4_9BACT|nr:sigma-70 family RNA polymerase sigma factor [Anaerohalosphaera lusitana]AQT68742.1 RNA polymerase sigma factor CnrH [Anaerohalosphaera lusitana]